MDDDGTAWSASSSQDDWRSNLSRVQMTMDADENGCVTISELPLDSLPKMLFAPTVLRGLTELHMNRISIRSLPSSIMRLTALKILDLSQNNVLGAVTEHIGEMVGLKVLKLGKTDLQELPSSIGKLTGLVILDLEWCEMLQALPKEMGRMVGLRTHNLSDCGLKEQSLGSQQDR
jgi:Leucine-rich repeat (LRR) protein